jgi:hypothetical protein
MEKLDLLLVKASIAKANSLEHQANSLLAEADSLVKEVQSLCTHPIEEVIEGDYYPSSYYSYARPPFRVCKLCGYSEESWRVGYKINTTTEVPNLSRESAMKLVRGKIHTGDDLYHLQYPIAKHISGR